VQPRRLLLRDRLEVGPSIDQRKTGTIALGLSREPGIDGSSRLRARVQYPQNAQRLRIFKMKDR
jgi:hypothetical protein